MSEIGNSGSSATPPSTSSSTVKISSSDTAAALGIVAGVSTFGALQVSTDPTTLFGDVFDGGAVDTTDRWTTQVSTGTVTQSSGRLLIDASTTTLARAGIFSKQTFPPATTAPYVCGFSIQLEASPLANVSRHWGMATLPGTPTVAAPVTDGIIFQLTETGTFRAAVYSSGALLTSVDLTAFKPTDGATHSYYIIFRADTYLFGFDAYPLPIASIVNQTPATMALPLCMGAVNAATPPASGQVFSCNQTVVGDVGKNTNQIADGAFPFRKATVKGASTAAAATDLPLVVALHPTSPVPVAVTAAGLGKAEDAASASGDTGVFILGVRRDTLTTSASTTGDYNEIALSQYGDVLTRAYEKHAKTYSCVANITLAASATDVAIMPGNATNTVFVTRVLVSGTQTTGGLVEVLLVKRSTANSGGTSAAMTVIPHDANDAAAVSAPLSYTANPTPGTTVGTVRRVHVALGAATAVANTVSVLELGDKGRPVILRGVAQGLAVNLNGVTVTGGVVNVTFEWFEI